MFLRLWYVNIYMRKWNLKFICLENKESFVFVFNLMFRVMIGIWCNNLLKVYEVEGFNLIFLVE